MNFKITANCKFAQQAFAKYVKTVTIPQECIYIILRLEVNIRNGFYYDVGGSAFLRNAGTYTSTKLHDVTFQRQ